MCCLDTTGSYCQRLVRASFRAGIDRALSIPVRRCSSCRVLVREFARIEQKYNHVSNRLKGLLEKMDVTDFGDLLTSVRNRPENVRLLGSALSMLFACYLAGTVWVHHRGVLMNLVPVYASILETNLPDCRWSVLIDVLEASQSDRPHRPDRPGRPGRVSYRLLLFMSFLTVSAMVYCLFRAGLRLGGT